MAILLNSRIMINSRIGRNDIPFVYLHLWYILYWNFSSSTYVLQLKKRPLTHHILTVSLVIFPSHIFLNYNSNCGAIQSTQEAILTPNLSSSQNPLHNPEKTKRGHDLDFQIPWKFKVFPWLSLLCCYRFIAWTDTKDSH